jgi:hypothetical protein
MHLRQIYKHRRLTLYVHVQNHHNTNKTMPRQRDIVDNKGASFKASSFPAPRNLGN